MLTIDRKCLYARPRRGPGALCRRHPDGRRPRLLCAGADGRADGAHQAAHLGPPHGCHAPGGRALGSPAAATSSWAGACSRMGGCSLCRRGPARTRRRTSTTRTATGWHRPANRSSAAATAAYCCHDGRVLLVPWSATSPLIYDPRRDAITTSAAATPPETADGRGLHGRGTAAGRPRAAGAQPGAGGAGLRPGGGQPGGGAPGSGRGEAAGAACCSPMGGCYCRSTMGTARR